MSRCPAQIRLNQLKFNFDECVKPEESKLCRRDRLPVTAKNKCGSGQPPKPHCFRGCSRLPSSARDGRSSRPRSEERQAAMPSEALASAFEIQRFHPALEEDSEEAAMPGLRLTGHEPEFPRRLTLERVTGNAEFWPAALGNFARFGCRSLCRRARVNATGNCCGLVQKVWSGESSCGTLRIKRADIGNAACCGVREWSAAVSRAQLRSA